MKSRLQVFLVVVLLGCEEHHEVLREKTVLKIKLNEEDHPCPNFSTFNHTMTVSASIKFSDREKGIERTVEILREDSDRRLAVLSAHERDHVEVALDTIASGIHRCGDTTIDAEIEPVAIRVEAPGCRSKSYEVLGTVDLGEVWLECGEEA